MQKLLQEFTQALDEGIHDPGIFKAIFIAGPPGAGKNRVISELGLNAAGLKLQDIDHTLSYLNKRAAPTNPDYKRGLGTTLKRQDVFQREMLGLIINTTGRNYEELVRLNKQLKATGYDTFMVFVDVEYDVAFRRIQDRPKHATNPADANRAVDFDYFEQAYDAAKENVDFYSLIFNEQFAFVTNNVIEDDLVTEDAESENEFKHSLRIAAKKVQRFLRKPLTPKAKEIVSQISNQ